MTYTESIKFLYRLQKFGMKFGLHGIRSLSAFLDHPEKKFPAIHIAGTNGKGSTASMIASILTAAGYKTGLYTSPHLLRFNERIRINGRSISSRTVAKLTSDLHAQIIRDRCTFFEAVTALAFRYFADSRVDIAVIETGLGGRLDATNILQPLVSVITTLGLEHTQILGNSLEKIAYEKGGIIKKSVPCITAVQSPRAIRVLKDICKKKHAPLIRVSPDSVQVRRSSLLRQVGDFQAAGKMFRNTRVSLAGPHQMVNALLAIQAVEWTVKTGEFSVTPKDVRQGLGNIQQLSGIHARLSVVHKNPLVLADVAHNPDAVRVLCRSLNQIRPGKYRIVFGLMQDKHLPSVVSELSRIARSVFVVEAKTERSRRAVEIGNEFRRAGIPVEEYHSVASGFASALKQERGSPILITGSHFVVGEALAFLKKEKYLTINQ